MSWQFAMLLQNVLASVFALESRILAKKYKQAHFQILAGTFAFVYVVFLIYASFNASSINFADVAPYVLPLVLTAVSFTIWSVLTFVTLRYVDAAIGILFSALNILAVVLIATITLGEGLSIIQCLGTALLFLAMIIIFRVQKSTRKTHNLNVALVLTLIASLAFGFAITTEKYLLNNIGAPTYAIVGIGLQFAFLLIPAIIYRPKEFKKFKISKFRNRVILLGAIRGGAGLLFIISLVLADNASIIGALSGFKIILTTILAAILLKELTFIKYKLFAACIACVGVGLILW